MEIKVYVPKGVDSYITETAISISGTLLLEVSGRAYLTPTFIPANSSDMTLKWERYNPDVAICYGGMVTGILAGTGVI